MSRPTAKHPIALAFQDVSATITASSSSKIGNKIKELNWRQQYSQAEYYPFEYMEEEEEKNVHVEIKVRQKQCGEQDGTGTGAVVWNAAHCLSSYMCYKHAVGSSDVEGKKIIDLGTGTGLTGIVAMNLGAEEVCFTDVGPVLELTKENVSINIENMIEKEHISEGSEGRTRTEEYWWGSGTLGVKCFDCILIADCILPKLYPMEPLVAAIDELLVEGEGGVCLVSYEHRTWFEFDPREKFAELCEEAGLKLRRISEGEIRETAEDIIVWEVKRKIKET